MSNAVGRPALYYPYIHIRSEHWLKATLLCAPMVKRIVPDDYTPEDLPNIVKYTHVVGVDGPLLQGVPASSPAAYQAQVRLLTSLCKHEERICRKYRRSQAPNPDQYWIHDAKFNQELLHYLRQHDLAWRSSDPNAYGHRTWYALHPALGSAVMTTLGLSIAREQHYDIVTPSIEFHETLLATKEDAIFDTLVSSDQSEAIDTATASQTRRDLGQLVITMTGINYQALRPEDIPEIQASEHFCKFQQLIRTRAQSIDREEDPEAYKDQLKSEAGKIVEEWQQTRNDVSGGLRDALFEQALTLGAEALKACVRGPDVTDLLATGGVAIGLLIRRGLILREKQRETNPFQYLTEIVRAQNGALRMTFPLGLET